MANKYRELCARAIQNNGGYSRGYHERNALSWEVGVYESIPDYDEMFKKVVTKVGDTYNIDPATPLDADLLEELKEEWESQSEQDALYYSIAESMRWGVTDCDSYRTIRPEIAHRYGLPYERFPKQFVRRKDECAYYPAKVEGWVVKDPYIVPMFDVTWSFQGRGGKHLCLNEFEGKSLEMSSEDLAERIRTDDSGEYSNAWCQQLVAFIHECDLCFTGAAVSQEFQYQCTFQFYQKLEEIEQETESRHKAAEDRALEQEIITNTKD